MIGYTSYNLVPVGSHEGKQERTSEYCDQKRVSQNQERKCYLYSYPHNRHSEKSEQEASNCGID